MLFSMSVFGLDEKLQQVLDSDRIYRPSAIQSLAIPPLLSGKDIIACSPTGSGKTYADLVPLLHSLLQSQPGRALTAIVLVPTRELAFQVFQRIQHLSAHTTIRSTLITAGYQLPKQSLQQRSFGNLIVATPGRLHHLIAKKNLRTHRVSQLILDEADKLLSDDFDTQLNTIQKALPKCVQTACFSASPVETMRAFLPHALTIDCQGNSPRIEQQTHSTHDLQHKKQLLSEILRSEDLSQAIVFTATKATAKQLSLELNQNGYESADLHSDLPTQHRIQILKNMQQQKNKILVTTDVAARGIDLNDISHVINFDLPYDKKEYLHRIGRSGRWGQKGVAISFHGPDRGLYPAHQEKASE